MLPWDSLTFTKKTSEEIFGWALIFNITASVCGEAAHVLSSLKCASTVSASNEEVKGAQLESPVCEAAADEWQTPGGLVGPLLLDQINPLH